MTANEVPAEALERICDAQCNGGKGDGVVFFDIYQHDVCNHTLSGTIDIEGTVYGFIIENGNWDGTVIKEWGPEGDVGLYEPPPPGPPLTFIPKDPGLKFNRPMMYKVYLLWRMEPWFKQKEEAYAYDRHFQPGGAIEKHYREWADSKGMKIGTFTADDRS